MKKLMIIIGLFLAIFLFLGCKNEEPKDEKKEEDKTIKEDYVFPYGELKDEDFDVTKYDLNEIPLVFMEKLYRLENYKKTTTGETIAKMLITYHQSIDDCYIKNNNENHILIKSNSALQKVYHEAFYNQDTIKYREKDGNDFIDVSYDEYINKFGLIPDERNLEGFIITDKSIISVEKIDNDNSYYEYKVIINGEIGSEKVKQRMKTFGDLDDYPVFQNVEITLIIKEDFTPVEIHLSADYDIKYPILGKMKCHQEYVSKYEIDGDNK